MIIYLYLFIINNNLGKYAIALKTLLDFALCFLTKSAQVGICLNKTGISLIKK